MHGRLTPPAEAAPQLYRPSRRAALSVAAASILVGALLRFLFIGAKSMWLDEVYSLVFSASPWPAFVRTIVGREANMVAYYLLLRPWLALGDGEAVVRSLSALLGVATIPALYALGARLFGRGAGALGGALLATHAFAVKYAQEARGYALLMLLCTVAGLLLVRAVERPTGRAWAAYAVVGSLVVYAHFYGVLVLAAQWLSLAPLLSRRRDPLPWRPVFGAALLTGVLLSPLALFLLAGRLAGASYWMRFPNEAELDYFRYTLVGAGDWTAERIFLSWVYGLAVVVTVVAAVREGRAGRLASRAPSPALASAEPTSERLLGWRYWLLLSWALVPTALTLGVSLVRPIFQDRYLIGSVPALVLLAGVALSTLRPRLRWSLLALVVATSLHGVADYYARPDKEEWRGATAHVAAAARADDAVILYEPYVRACYDYYRRRIPGVYPEVAYPSWPGRAGETPDSALAAVAASRRRVWVVSSHADDRGRFIEDSLARHFPTVHERKFPGVRVLLFERAAAAR